MQLFCLYFMIFIFGVISMITRKKYKVEGSLKNLSFPVVFSKLLYLCFAIAIVFSVIILFFYRDISITVFMIILGLISALIALAIERYKIVLAGDKLIVIYPVGKEQCIQISKIKYIQKDQSGSYKIVVTDGKITKLNPMLVGVEEFVDFLKEKGVCLHIEE